MERKAKFIIIGLAIFTLVCLFLFIQAFGAKQNMTRERDDLRAENTTLNAKVDKLTVSLRGYESKIDSLSKDLETVSQLKDELQNKFEEANKAKEELAQKLKEQSGRQESSGVSRQEGATFTADAYWADVLKAKSELELQLSNLRNDFKSLQINNEQAQREKSGLELELNNLKRENEDFRRQIDYNQKLMDSMAQELVREKNDKTQIQNNYKTIKNENSMLSRQLKNLNSRKVSLEKKIQELQVNKGELEQRISQMEVMLTQGVSQIGGLKERIDNIKSGTVKAEQAVVKPKKDDSVELPAIVVKPQSEGLSSAGFIDSAAEGKVLAVNRDNNFVIVDLGQDSGLKTGDALRVLRGDKAVASVEAIQVRRNISACDIKKEAEPIKIGDAVAR